MVLDTDLKHLTTDEEVQKVISENENVMICCGRMGPMCVPVYGIMEDLEESGNYDNVIFKDLLFDSPVASYIRNLPQCAGFTGLPFTVYFKNGNVVTATSSIQNKKQIVEILDREFAK